jgi:NADH-quinone oxidoreductase subunit J
MTTAQVILATLVVVLGASGSYLLLPHRHGTSKTRTVHALGAVLAAVSLLGLLRFFTPSGPFLSGLFFYLFSITAVAGALLTVTSRNPIHSALWFASVVLSTAGLFLLASASFLAAGTVIVYAGAIIVTFLFVIMLAQMEGKAEYDRAARAPGSATFTCFLLLWCLLFSLGTLAPERSRETSFGESQLSSERGLVRGHRLVEYWTLSENNPSRQILDRSLRPTSSLTDGNGAEKPSVAGLGEALYSDHLLTVELAGSLLFVALIAAVVITNPRRPVRPEDSAAATAARAG